MREKWLALVETAATQAGFFTSAQGKAVGYDRKLLSYHCRVGNLRRVSQGLYRMVGFVSEQDDDDLVRVLLETRDRDGQPRGVLSHQTALDLHGLGDVFADHYHLTIAPGVRKKRIDGVVYHTGRWDRFDVTPWRLGYVTTPIRTLVDVGDDPGISTEQLTIVVQDAIERDIISPRRLEEVASGRLKESLGKVLK